MGMAWKRSEAAIGTVGRVGAEQALVEKINLAPTPSASHYVLGFPGWNQRDLHDLRPLWLRTAPSLLS